MTDEKVNAIITYADAKKAQTDSRNGNQNGVIKKTPLGDFTNVRRSGIIAIKLKKNDQLDEVLMSSGSDEVFFPPP